MRRQAARDARRRFPRDGNTPLHEWEDNDIITWVFDDGFVPTAKLTNAGNFSIVSDHLGTPVEAYDAEGGLVWSAELDIYGRVIEHTGDVDFVPFRYQGQYADVETGLYYNRFRYYDPAIGQYTQQDPIGLAGNNPTLYAYVADTNAWVDVFGLDPIDQKTRDLLVKITGGYDGQGIYVFPGNSGKPYVGQSGNIIERISQHLRSGKLSPDNLEALTFDKTSLSKQALNDAEAKKMADLGGRNNLENIRRPPHTGDLSDEDLSKENTPSCSERA